MSWDDAMRFALTQATEYNDTVMPFTGEIPNTKEELEQLLKSIKKYNKENDAEFWTNNRLFHIKEVKN